MMPCLQKKHLLQKKKQKNKQKRGIPTEMNFQWGFLIKKQ